MRIFEYKNDFTDLEIEFTGGFVEKIEIISTVKTVKASVNKSPANALTTVYPEKECRMFLNGLIMLLDAYFLGRPVDFSHIPVNFSEYSNFSRKILKSLQTVKYGETVSYKGLAVKAGLGGKYSRACARALSKNKTPIIIPCHRVIMSDGRLGGFTGGDGASFKEKLISLERQGIKNLDFLNTSYII